MVTDQTTNQPDPTTPEEQVVVERLPFGATQANLRVRQIADRETPAIAAQLKEAITDLNSTDRFFVIRLEEVQFMNSMGLGMLINLRNRLHERGCQTILIGVSDHLKSLLDLVRASRLFRVADDDASVKAIVRGGSDPE